MENSFFEYRDKTSVDGESSCEIENSFMDESFAPKKTPAKKNQTVFIPESESDEGELEDVSSNISKSKTRDMQYKIHNITCSSDDDFNKRPSLASAFVSPKKVILSSSEDEDFKKRTSVASAFASTKKVILSSSEDEDSLPEVNESTRLSVKSSDSFIGRKNKKRIMILDSDTDNSIIINHNRQKKKCLKNTPAKISVYPDKKSLKYDTSNMSYESIQSASSNDETDDDVDNISYDDRNNDKEEEKDVSNTETYDKNIKNDSQDHNIADDKSKSCSTNDDTAGTDKLERKNSVNSTESDTDGTVDYDNNVCEKNNKSNDKNYTMDDSKHIHKSINSKDNDSDGTVDYDYVKENESKDRSCKSDDDYDQNDDQMFMSRATRMSIMGIVPKDNESDDSDYIQSDNSRPSSAASLGDLPDSGINITKTQQADDDDADASRITCSPITSPLRDITNKESPRNDSYSSRNSVHYDVVDLTQMIEADDLKSKIQQKLKEGEKENVIDDDVVILNTKPEVIALSSDSEDEELKAETSPTLKKSPKKEKPDEPSTKKLGSDIKQYLVPPSYPNQVMYVHKHQRENELNTLNGLKEDLQNVKVLLETMDLDTLPDGGKKLIERLTVLEAEVRVQGDKVASMVVMPDEPGARPKDALLKNEKGLSWDDIQKASNAVQPRMFGKQALATHMAERNLILERLRDLYESLASRPSEATHAPQPRMLRTPLMPHQLHALAWLQWRETQRPSGGILADDMGLGKTITMISLIASDKEKNLDPEDDDDDEEVRGSSRVIRGGTLVVCPASLMTQWAEEVTKHCTAHALSVSLHHGAQRTTQPHRLSQNDLVLTTYNILQREREKNGVLTRILWRRVILDEAHVVRNHKSQTSVAVSSLRGRRRWALTGTPLHNKDLDLFALLKFMRCTPFDDLTMWKKWIDNKSLGGQERLSTIMGCVMLRRTKLQLQQRGQLNCLPERSAHQRDVTLNQQEMNVYQKVLVFSKTLFAQFLHQRAEKQADGLGYITQEKDTAYAKMHKKMVALQGAKPVKSHEILVLLLRLRQVCCHCGLIAAMLDEESDADVQPDPAGQDLLAELNKLTLEDATDKRKSASRRDSGNEEEEVPSEGTTVAEAIRSVLSPNNPVFKLDRRSSKIQAVMDCLNEDILPNEGEKAVVVSQWTSVLNLVEHELKKAKIECVTLNGSVSVPARPPLIDALNNPKGKVRVMLLSLCAGGVGLNLCGANHLLLLDPHWNPQLEEQAQDRIYRVGQTRHVHIYRFMCVDTVEQSIRKLQQAKLEMAESVLTGARHTNASKLTIEDLKVLFNMGPQE